MLLPVFLTIILGCTSVWSLEPAVGNWTFDYDVSIAEFALDMASAAYAVNPTKCIEKHRMILAMRKEVSCDYVWDKCWSYVAYNESWIVFAVRGTTSKLQLITELVETMSAPKSRFPSGGSVQRYFNTALKSLWSKGFDRKIKKLKILYPNATVLFTGHSLGAAVASLASSLFAYENQDILTVNQIRLITFGQPRVGNQEYAQGHDYYVPNTWRIIHRYDIVAHIPYCYEALFSHQCVSLFNHGPWHSGTEIWYTSQEMTANNTYTPIFRICAGEPVNEDRSCSNNEYIHYNINDHLYYFDKDVSSHGDHGCVG
ncbi:Lipase domain containing protein [Aphelenchoides bicaudatus]|nr:Lipase domain containing protein [Aphelenchoides bicaudatus]